MKYSLTLGILAMRGRGFEYPTDLVPAKNGKIYVANRSRAPALTSGQGGIRVTVLDLNSEFYGTFGFSEISDENLFSPTCLTEDNFGSIYITDDFVHQVKKFDSDGNFVSAWGQYGSGIGQFDGPSGIAVDKQNNIYISDTHNHRIQKYSSEGDLIESFGSYGSNPGQFNLPWGIGISHIGEIYVADWANDRIQRFSSEGEYISTVGSSGRGEGQLLRPSGVTVDEFGYFYVADWGNERVQIFDNHGDFLQSLRGEATLSKWAQSFMESNVDERDTRKNANLEPVAGIDFSDTGDPHRESAYVEKLFWGPVSVKLDSDGRLYVTDGNRHRVQVFERVAH
tara:strand:+ start:2077 stop:3093 length:1017 start_codon:yes stop_codon:yes gene_type:complete